MYIYVNPNLPVHPTHPTFPLGNHILGLYLSVSFCFATNFICDSLVLKRPSIVSYWVSLVAQWLKKNVPASAGDRGLIPGLGRSSGEGNGN